MLGCEGLAALLAFSAARNYTGLLPDRSHKPVGASPLFCWTRRMAGCRCVNARGACGRKSSRRQCKRSLAGQYRDWLARVDRGCWRRRKFSGWLSELS